MCSSGILSQGLLLITVLKLRYCMYYTLYLKQMPFMHHLLHPGIDGISDKQKRASSSSETQQDFKCKCNISLNIILHPGLSADVHGLIISL